jgi:hypothetical protein
VRLDVGIKALIGVSPDLRVGLIPVLWRRRRNAPHE